MFSRSRLMCLMLLLACCWAPFSLAQTLPASVQAALARAQIGPEALSVVLTYADPQRSQTPLLSHRASVPRNPASVMKLVTTFAALDVLGPAFVWRTQVGVDGPIKDGVLAGNLYIQGQGDPKLTIERLWLLLRRVQGLGIHTIAGDIVLDHSAFVLGPQDPAEFDGEPLRPYNVGADALLINFKTVGMTLVPNPANQTASVSFEPRLSAVQLPSQVPLSLQTGGCGDYRSALQADFSDPARIRLDGSYLAVCGEKTWSFAYADASSYAVRAVQGMWQDMRGQLKGMVRTGRMGTGLQPAFEFASVPLAEVVRDINKFSNNVMAQQLFLTLSQQQRGTGTLEGSREWLRAWWTERFGAADLPTLDQGSGLSRQQRISAQALARLLVAAYQSPRMPEFIASLPIAGVDGTLSRLPRATAAHLKTGSLQGVQAWAGYLHRADGQRLVLVALINHANASNARPVLQALVDAALSRPLNGGAKTPSTD